MKTYRTFHTGTLPYSSDSTLTINLPPEEVLFFDLSLKEIHRIRGYQAIALSDRNALLRKNHDLTFYSIENRKVQLDLKNTRVFPFQIKEKILLNYRKSPTLELRDFSTADILWHSKFEGQNRIIQGVCNESVFVGNILNSTTKICVDVESGKSLWRRNINMSLEVKSTFAGNNYLIGKLLISQASRQGYFGVNVINGELIWHLNLEKLAKISTAISTDRMFVFVRELDNIYILTIDLLTGEVLNKELLTEQLQMLQIYPHNSESNFGQASFYNNHLFFGSDNKLIKLNLSTYEIEMVYEHTAVFYFSKVIGSKLFYSDNNFTTLVFDLSNISQLA